MSTTSPQSCSFITLLGAPNAGKSTLVNAMVGSKVAIVTPKVQTTRVALRGICMSGNCQLVLIDTPGVFTPKRPLEKTIVQEAWRNLPEGDQLMVLVDAKKGICNNTQMILDNLKQQDIKALLVLNKADKVKPETLLPLAATLNETGLFSHTFMISALKRQGVDDLIKHLVKHAKEEPWAFPEDQVSDAPARVLAAEVTREHLFFKLQNELPYSLSVETETFEEKKNGQIVIRQMICVAKEGHKAIIVGKGGATIKEIGEASRGQLSKLFDTKVHLFLFVKVTDRWIQGIATGERS